MAGRSTPTPRDTSGMRDSAHPRPAEIASEVVNRAKELTPMLAFHLTTTNATATITG